MRPVNFKGDNMTQQRQQVTIAAPNFGQANFVLVGTSPLVINHFGKRKQGEVLDAMTNPKRSRSKSSRKAKDIEAEFKDAAYVSTEGWYGINAACIRNACISACRVAGYQMTKAKLSVFVEAQGLDRHDGTPLLRIYGPKPKQFVANVRNRTGVIDIRVRPMWVKWEIRPTIEFDADQFKVQDVANLLHRAGKQVGIGEGRHDSRESAGIGFGCFTLKNKKGR